MTALETQQVAGSASDEHGRGFVSLLRAEWTKLRTVRGWVIALAVSAVLMDLLGIFGAGQAHIDCVVNGHQRSGSACRPAIPTGPGGEAVDDNFEFLHRTLSEHGAITAQVTSLTGRYTSGAAQSNAIRRGVQAWSKAGVLIAASTKPGAAYAAMMVTGSHGVRMQYDFSHDIAGRPGRVSPASPRWLRLTRSGGTVNGYESRNGVDWTLVGTANLTGFPANVQVGMFAASPNHSVMTSVFGGESGTSGPSVATGAFDHVRLAGAASDSAWRLTAVGSAPGPGPLGDEAIGLRRSGGRFMLSGTGDIVPIVPTGGQGEAAPIQEHLMGSFAGLIAMAVVGALFVTTEYRRGLIRTTLAAIPQRGLMLLAKEIVIGVATFAVGLVASVIALFAGNWVSRSEGLYGLPVSHWTEARVLLGTAGLLALSSVLAVAVGSIVRRSAAAVAIIVVGIVLPYLVGVSSVLPVAASEWLLRVTPAAAFAIQQSIPRYSQVSTTYQPPAYLPLSPWAGFAVLCGYVLAAMAVAVVLIRRRDA